MDTQNILKGSLLVANSPKGKFYGVFNSVADNGDLLFYMILSPSKYIYKNFATKLPPQLTPLHWQKAEDTDYTFFQDTLADKGLYWDGFSVKSIHYKPKPRLCIPWDTLNNSYLFTAVMLIIYAIIFLVVLSLPQP